MIYLYDNAIVEDLQKSFNKDTVNSTVKVVSPENFAELVAQMQQDTVTFPVIALSRADTISIDSRLNNFTRCQKGVVSVLDPKTNELYYEKSYPIKLSYDLSVFTTNTADMDELLKELIFKYTAMYFLTVKLPYECARKIRFGVSIDSDYGIEKQSSSSEYIQEGHIYQSTVRLVCDGCVIVSYTPAKLSRMITEVDFE